MSITAESIIDDLENDRLRLPTLPEVAIKVRETADDEDASIRDVAKIIETDAALSARIVQVGNSALYRGANPAETVQAAAMRMGLDTVRTLTTSLVMKQLFQATHPVVDHYLRIAWKRSTYVAAFSTMLARSSTSLESDIALLAGLTHSIGLAPILIKAESYPVLLNDTRQLERLMYEIYPLVGSQILKNWDFSEALVSVPAEHLNIDRDGNNGKADYVDIVQVALLQTLDDDGHPLAQVDYDLVSAFDRLGMRDAVEEINMTGGVIEVEEIKDAIF
ncbi:MAG: HDOD domain-containing protein [Gammaproteobacteria bacterium]|nr:HDOD domain-containing protein [Gammaproteobacteria bacterium]MCP4471959.1 HDOD domain-containing protein [Gammaproteobacteria bacterium]